MYTDAWFEWMCVVHVSVCWCVLVCVVCWVCGMVCLSEWVMYVCDESLWEVFVTGCMCVCCVWVYVLCV